MERLKPNIKPDRFDYLFETITIVGLICLVVIPIIFYGKLPESMPKHFDIYGQPDSYGNKGTILLLPILGTILYFGLTLLSKYPHTFNYPAKVTNENAEKIYKKGIIILRIVKLAVISLFMYLTIMTIEIGLGQLNKLSVISLPIILIIFSSMSVFSIIWMRR